MIAQAARRIGPSPHEIESPYTPGWAEIASVRPMTAAERFFEVVPLDGRSIAYQPGQFMMVSVMGVGEAPFSISSSPTRKGVLEFCLRQVGEVTRALHQLSPGSVIGLRGPYGRGFPVEAMEGRDLLIIAGGLGLIPLRSLINFAIDRRERFGRVIILSGTKTPEETLFVEEQARWSRCKDVELLTAVDRPNEAWQGNVGVITTLIPKVDFNPRTTMAAVVGPLVMYRFVLLELLSRGLPEEQILVSLERRMKCGTGKCGHCQINNLYVCRDGPVFSYARIKHLPEAL